jgi:lysophospholipid acyltransferase (LPLAT)-like uncharacterized protein
LSEKKVLHLLAGVLGPALIFLWGKTIRWDFVGEENLLRARGSEGGPVIFAFWHGRMLPLLYAHRSRGIQILISQHRDGEIIARIARRFGCGAVRGSTTRGGREAIFGMGRLAQEGADLAVTPDGPHGPREVVQRGVILLGQRSGLPIVPLAGGGDADKCLSSWDRFRIPRPFHRCRIMYGEPMRVDRRASPEKMEELRLELERRLKAISEKCLSC